MHVPKTFGKEEALVTSTAFILIQAAFAEQNDKEILKAKRASVIRAKPITMNILRHLQLLQEFSSEYRYK